MSGSARNSAPATSGAREATDAPSATVPHGVLAVPRVRFPPRWETVSLAVEPAAAARQGIALYSASRGRPLLAQRALWALSFVGGSRVIPGQRQPWNPPMGVERFDELWSTWCDLVDGPVAGFAAYVRAQPTRTGTALMLCAGPKSLFVRVQQDAAGLDLERRVSAAAQHGTRSFRVPAVRGEGTLDGWHWLAYESLSTRPHTPLRPSAKALTTLTEEVSALVETVLPRPDGVPAHWRGSHGDLTPWNLRRVGSSAFLIDWEDARWAPPGADSVYYAAARSALRARPARRIRVEQRYDEARRYWHDIVSSRQAVRVEGSLRDQLLEALSPATDTTTT